MSRIGEFKAKLDEGKRCLGASITFADPLVTECIGNSVDFFWIDMEHSGLTINQVLLHLLATRAVGFPGLVRVPVCDTAFIKGALDGGADGVIVPQIRSTSEVEQAVGDGRYPPKGRRGFGPRVPSAFGRMSTNEVLESGNREVFVCVQIETAEALADIERIVSVPSLDAVVVGPSDLSIALGVPDRPRGIEVRRAIDRIVSVARRQGLYVGSGVGYDLEWAGELLDSGIQWLQVGSDYDYLRSSVGEVREVLRDRLSQGGVEQSRSTRGGTERGQGKGSTAV